MDSMQLCFFSEDPQAIINEDATISHLKINKRREQSIKPCRINNKRYLGNKYRILNFIRGVVDSNCHGVESVADIFAGTGAVASAFCDKILITNDILYSNYICHVAWFNSHSYSEEKLRDFIRRYNSMVVERDNYVSRNFEETFFNLENCRKIGFIRADIEIAFKNKIINERERALLITSLLYGMDKIANTCGHYDAYRKNGDLNKKLELMIPVPGSVLSENKTFNEDANKLVRFIETDLVYIDPPYNSRQYCDAYHLLENIARWDRPDVFGVARKMNRDHLKSDYCTVRACEALTDLVRNITAKYILLSYNNMASRGNARSNARITDIEILDILTEKGKVKIFSKPHRHFNAGKTAIDDNEERLFLCEVK